MKLRKFDFYLDWPASISIINLRRFITGKLMKKGMIIRWSIVNIKVLKNHPNSKKKIRINAVLANPINAQI